MIKVDDRTIIWTDVKGYEGLYEINNLGEIKSLGRLVQYSDGRLRRYDGKIMKQHVNAQGYMSVRLTDENKESKLELVHRLVLSSFEEKLDDELIVNHIDGNKTNNNLDNLEWTTYSGNNQHAYDTDLKKNKRKVVMYDLEGNILKTFDSIHCAERETGINYKNIQSVCKNRRIVAGGYKWSYIEDIKLNEKQILFSPIREGVKIPSKISENVGYDIYANFEEDCIAIEPHTVVLVPTGLVSAFSPKWGVILKERSSTGTKGIEQRCGVIDSGFRGEWKVPITNGNERTLVIAKEHCVEQLKQTYGDKIIIYPYEKAIAQAMVVEVPKMKVEKLDLETILNIESERGTGMLGSSNK